VLPPVIKLLLNSKFFNLSQLFTYSLKAIKNSKLENSAEDLCIVDMMASDG